MSEIINIAAYKFVELDALPARRSELQRLCANLRLKGTILLSPEGINMFVAGERDGIDRLLGFLTADACFANLEVKESVSDYQPFNRMLVRLKNEIIAFGVAGIDPARGPGRKLAPTELKRWLDEGRPLTLLDTRNEYEIELGTFSGAQDLKLDHFRNFPDAVKKIPEAAKKQPLVMFCTGGIRCEKAGPLMEQQGFQKVFQLDGGILKYFEECGDAHWDGDCFVFDQRVALKPDLTESEAEQCFACRAILSPEEQQSPWYVPEVSCPHCHEDVETVRRRVIAERQRQLQVLTNPLPGSIPYDNRRPLSVPARLDRRLLLDVLDEMHPHVGRQKWLDLCQQGRVLHKDHAASADKIVRSGERYHRLVPATVEPDVNAAIEILYEDESLIVVNKPAPLAMHPSGRFNRNTLIYLLHQLYSPQSPRAAHRLDANTTGVVVLCRTRAVAALVQPQFQRGDVSKDYLVRVVGHPALASFACHQPIGNQPQQAGVRTIQEDGQPSSTEFHLLQRFDDGTSLLRAHPRTGRTNQIRVHLWHLNLPVCGDPAYLPQQQLGRIQTQSVDDPPMCLHAHRIELTHPTESQHIHFEAPPPAWTKPDAYFATPSSKVTNVPSQCDPDA